jgi:hypothetical protein
MGMNEITPQDTTFFFDIAAILHAGRSAVNSVMVETYWRIGRRIVEQEQHSKNRADYGEYLIVNLSRYLGETFGKGFSVANLKNFRRFYLTFPELFEKATQCVANLSWTNIRLIRRLEDKAEKLKIVGGGVD